MADTVVRKYRRYSDAEKRAIVAECAEPGASVSRVARRHDVNANQVHQWRRRLRDEVALEVVSWRPVSADATLSRGVSPAPITPAPLGSGTLELVLASGHRLQVVGAVDATLLDRCLRRLLA